ncbi:MAG: amino-acid N-acetyltransferase [Antricoccus sp.]
MSSPELLIRRARVSDVSAIRAIVQPLAEARILVAKETVAYYEGIQEFRIAEVDGEVAGFGALHVMWEDLAEVRTLATSRHLKGTGVGSAILKQLLLDAAEIGVGRLFCLTFETDFFNRHGFVELEGTPIEPDVYAELLRSPDDGVAEFLDLARVKPNTLGNCRMIKYLDNDAVGHPQIT